MENPSLSTIIANWDLGSGESHVLSWALSYSDYEAVVDDLAARKCAKALSISPFQCEARHVIVYLVHEWINDMVRDFSITCMRPIA
jgi:hypothetical protein